MSDHSAIEWTDATWSPVTGCTRVSPGCANCYIERTPPFRIAGRRFTRVGTWETTGVVLHPERLDQPLRWRKPRRVFVCSMADLFHENVPNDYIARAFAVMALAPQHTFQVLTKRPDRAKAWMEWALDSHICDAIAEFADEDWAGQFDYTLDPLPNVWLGVSIENARYTWRADVLREIPAAVRFISAEPLLGSLYDRGNDGDSPLPRRDAPGHAARDPVGARGRETRHSPDGDDRWPDAGVRLADPAGDRVLARRAPLDLTGIDWVIAGGESGPNFRPVNLDHVRELRDACLARCIECSEGDRTEPARRRDGRPCRGHRIGTSATLCARPAFFFKQVGGRTPKAGGRLLDGREWNEMPEGWNIA